MKSIAASALILTAAALLLPACHTDAAKAPVDPPSSSAVTRPPAGVVQLDPENLKQIKVGQAKGEQTPEALTTTGKVQFDEDKIARILPPVSGQIQQLKVQVGDAVHAGQVLFMLNSRDVAAAFAEHTGAHRDLDLAQQTYAMTQDLFEHQAASKLSLQQTKNEVDKDLARLRQSEQVLRVLGVDMPEEEADESSIVPRVPVRAPIDGVITQRSITEGQFVDTQAEPLLTLADLSTVWVLADVFERNLRDISLGQRAEVTTTAYPDERFVARVAQIGNVVDPETHTVTVRFLVSNAQRRLKPGMLATASIQLADAPAQGLTVPATAVFMEDGKSYSYVQTNPREFKRREVSAVPDGEHRMRVIAGLGTGDVVVTDGVLLLRQQEAQASRQ